MVRRFTVVQRVGCSLPYTRRLTCLVALQLLTCVAGVLQPPPLQELTLRARDAAELTQVKTELVAKEQKVREMKQLVGARVCALAVAGGTRLGTASLQAGREGKARTR